jgi:hypothetical protein
MKGKGKREDEGKREGRERGREGTGGEKEEVPRQCGGFLRQDWVGPRHRREGERRG